MESPSGRRAPWSQHLMNEKHPLSICYAPGSVLYKTLSSKTATHRGKKSSSADSFTDGRLRAQPSRV